MMTTGKIYKGATATYVDTPCGHYVRVLGPEHEKFACSIAALPELVEALNAWNDAATGKGFWSDAENKRLAALAKMEGTK